MLRFQNVADFDQATQTTELIAVVLITSGLAFFLSKMYSQFIRRGYLTGLFRVVIYNVWLTLFLTLYTFSTKNDMALSRLTFYFFLPINVILMYLSHLAIKAMVRHMAKGQSGWKTVIVTDAENVASMIENVRSTMIGKIKTSISSCMMANRSHQASWMVISGLIRRRIYSTIL
jgi:FlaA1/EpsC-like NDP-sugar epimerase